MSSAKMTEADAYSMTGQLAQRPGLDKSALNREC